MDRVAARELRRDHPRPRPHHLPRDRRAAATARSPRSRSKTLRQPRRRPLDDRAGHPDDALRTDALRRLQDPGDPLPGARRLHEHRHGRRLPRRRPARGDVRRRAGDRPRRARARRSTRSRCGGGTSSRPTRSRTTPGILAGLSVRQRRLRAARSTARSRSSTTTASAPSRRQARARGPLPRHRLLDLRRDLRRRAVGLDRHERPGLGRRPLGERERPRPPHRQGRRHDRLASRSGRGTRRRWPRWSRDELGVAARGRDGRARRHARHAVRLRHLRQPQRRRRHGRRLQRARSGSRQKATPHRGAHARGRRRGHRSTRTAGRSSSARPAPARRSRRSPPPPRVGVRPAAGRGAVPRRHGVLRPAELHLPVRHARRDRRGRPGDGRGRARPLRRSRRRRAR